jgi:ankyrin repeat protein
MSPGEAKPVNLQKEILKAAKSGAVLRLQQLLEQDAALISVRDADGSTPLHCATWKGLVALLKPASIRSRS